MRTTLTIEPDVAHEIKRRMASQKLSLKRVVNDALRAGLAASDKQKPGRFRVDPHPCGFKAGADLDKLNQLADELEAYGGSTL